MGTNDSTVTAVRILAREHGLAAPSVKVIEPEVRSGGIFPFCDLLESGGDKTENGLLLEEGILLGTIVIEWGYDVAAERWNEFKDWLKVAEMKFIEEHPAGIHYRGTYAVSTTTEKQTGLFRTVWTYDTLQAIGDFNTALHDGSTFGKLVAELNSFRDRAPGASFSQQMYQPARCVHRMV